MVPIKLRIRNFLSYGDPPQEIDLTGTHIATLVGNNGAGKSALLDAVTWALFGKARSNNNELTRKGATEMWVELEFDVEGQLYRIWRHYSKVKRNQTVNLEQWVNGKWHPIVSSQKVRAVEDEIKRLLKMDYDTFINTVFVLQGQSGEFMNLDPAERQDLLSKILGLDAFEQIEEKTKAQAKTLNGQIEEGKRRLSEIERELSERPKVVKDFEKKQRERENSEETLRRTDEEITRVQKERENLLNQKAKFDNLQDEEVKVRQQITEAEKSVSQFERELRQWQNTVVQEREIVEAWTKFQHVRQEAETLNGKANRLRDLEQQRNRFELAIQKVRADLEGELKAKETEAKNVKEQLRELQDVVSRKSEVETSFAELQKARQKLKEWDEKQRQWSNIKQQKSRLEEKIADEKAEWAKKEGELQQAKRQLESRIGAKPQIAKLLKQLDEERKKLDEWRQYLDETRKKREQISEQIAMISARQDQLKKATNDIREKLRLLEEHVGEPKCPLCETVLTPQRFSSLRRKLSRELEEKETELAEAEQEAKRVIETSTQLDNQIAQAEKVLQKQPELEQKFGDLKRRLSEITEAERELSSVENEWNLLQQQKVEAECRWRLQKQELDEQERSIGYDPDTHQKLREKVESLTRYEAEKERICQAEEEILRLQEWLSALESEIAVLRQKIETNDFAHEERSQLEKVNQAILNLGYDEERHRQLTAWLQENQEIPQRWQQLQTAKEQIPKLQKWVEEAKQRIANLKTRLSEIAQEKVKLQVEVAKLPKIEEQLGELQGRRKARENELQRVNQELGALRQKLEQLSQREREKSELEQRLSQLQEEKEGCEFLAKAFGRYGIPQMILHSIVQWLEWEANRLLARLTYNRMHLRFSLEAPTQSERAKLTIFIADELGDRPYELYSGGEKFRIDFAVRVALARLLAHRSGAPLKTLVIDEGFGSQDKEGLEALLEAIQNVADEFSRIIVVTHLEELRERFPVLIEVTKGSNGSQCRLITRYSQKPPEI
ncbi:MAG: AAA family ATPase [Candidatus Fervidibacter sp.]|uniref:AAA family ATPase n=1 Tax=Candidatus Fervidibacter sp. TaxID=3100871 RepID=UPI00404B36D3